MAKGLLLRKDGDEISVQLRGMLSVTGSEVAINAGVAGMGIVAASLPSLQRELERGELLRLLPDWDMGSLEAHALFPSSQAPKPSARAFVDYIVGQMRHS